VSAYAPTAAWVASVFNISPTLSIFLTILVLVLGTYSLYLLYTGIAALMKPPESRVLIYTMVVALGVGAIWLLFGVLFFGVSTRT